MDEPRTSLAGAAPSDLPEETLASFGGDELRARVFYDKYALRNEAGVVVERTPEEMWKRVAREIASVEPDEVKRSEWERRFYWLLEDFRFIPGGRILHGAGNPRRVTLLNCFPAGTRILTRQGFKSIEQIGVGEEVLTHQNRFRPVIHTLQREIEEPLRTFQLWYLGDQPICATKEHRFLSFDGTKVDWIAAEDLTPAHYVRVGRVAVNEIDAPTELDLGEYVEEELLEDRIEMVYTATPYIGGQGAVGVKESKRVRRKVVLDERFGLWLGFFIAEGGATSNSVYFTFSKEERSYAELICDLTEQLFGVKASLQERTEQPGYWLRVYAHSKLLAQFVRSFFAGSYKAHEKELPAWFLTVPPKVQKAFIAGLFLGDGVIRKDFVRLFLANPLLIRQVFAILLRLGIVASLRWEGILRYTRHRGMWIHVGTRQYVEAIRAWLEGNWDYESTIEEAPQNHFYRVVHGELFVKVKECGWTAPRRLMVYDLSVAEDHSFVAEFAVAHNCYVIPIREDSIEAIFDWMKEAARTYSFGGGVGTDLSVLRPRGSPVHNAARTSTGSVSFMELFSLTTGTIGQSGRRGALMITIADNHPDLLDFIKVKRNLTSVRYANISVRVSDAFMQAVDEDGTWDLRFHNERASLERTVRAREVWDELIKGARDYAEPGVIFWDTVKRYSTSEYNGMNVITTNPCSEVPLEPYGCCCLGNLCLSAFVLDPFTPRARIDWEALEPALRYATRFLDNVLDYNAEKHPLPQQREASLRSRRIGVGFTGLGDMLIKLRLKYDTPEAIDFVDRLFEQIKNIVYDESVNLAVEKGTFPAFSPKEHLSSLFIQTLDPKVIGRIREHGLRNVALLTVPPVGSGAALAGVTSGIEPVFDLFYIRRSESLSQEVFKVYHPLVREYMQRFNIASEEDLPDFFVTAHQIKPELRVQMQATIQRHIDHSISSCLTRNNLILTDRGFRYIDTIHAERREGEFVPLKGWRVFNEHGLVEASDFYYNGTRPVYKVTLEGGYEIEGTANHRVLVLTEDHGLCWRRLDELKEDDCIVLRKGLEAWGNLRELSEIYEKPFSAERRTNAHPIRFPHRITKPLARFLGYLLSDGGVLDNGNTVVFTQEKGEVLDHFCQLSEQLFGIRPKLERDLRGRNLYNAKIHSGLLTRFLGYLGASYRGKEKRTPLCVLSAGREIVKEFIRGLTLDGYVSRLSDGNPRITVLCNLSGRLVREIQQLLLNFGIESYIVTKPYSTSDFTKVHGRVYHHENRILYDLYLTAENAHRFMDLIGFAENRKNEQAWQVLRKTRLMRAPLGGVVPVNGQVVGALREAMKQVRSYQLYEQLHSLTQHMQARKVVARDHLLYALEATRTIAVVPDFVLDPTYTFKRVKSVVQLPEAQETFDLSVPEGHHYVANGIVSHNTVNLPRETSPEEVERIYFLAWKLGCKGVTVYREGSRQGILITEEEARRAREQVVVPLKAEAEKPGEPSRATPRPRPKVTHGRTERIETPRGRIYVTINEDEMGICEVFVKSLDVEAEAIGRLASLAMRAGVDPREIIEQLWRVQSTEVAMDRSSEGTVVRITTIAQGVALALGRALYGDGFRPDKEFPLATALPVPGPRYRQEILRFRSPAGGEQRSAPRVEMGEGGGVSKNGEVLEFAGVCPDCGARLIYENGCTLCRLCGYSKC